MTTHFWLGTHQASWLRQVDVPLFVSHRRLARYRTLPAARGPWALDSGGFTELSMHGRWVTEPGSYVDACRRYMTDVGHLTWAAPMDWMCEPFMLTKTGFTVDDHQGRTVENLLALRQLAPDVPYIPVLQGWAINDYLACIDRYANAGVDLTTEPLVGVGSVCRRQGTAQIATIFRELAGAGIRCHGFGVKLKGMGLYARYLTSADSLAWSYEARRASPMSGCTHAKCQNCLRYALSWRARISRRLAVEQGVLW